MSQPIPPNPFPVGYYGTPLAPPWRPTAVTVLAIVGIIFAALAILCTPISTVMLFVKLPVPSPALTAQRNDTALMGWMIGSAVYQLVIGLVLLIGSIGSLYMKPWARKTMVAYAFITIVAALLSTAVTLAWFMPRLERLQRQAGAPTPPAFIAPQVGALGGFLVGIIFPICVAYFFTRPEIKQAFDRAGGVPGDLGPASARYSPQQFAPPPPSQDSGAGPVI